MESSLFEDLLCFLQKEELVLKALRATNLKACLRTGTGTKGYEANAERAKYYRIYNKIEKSVTADQKATLMDWERRLCSEAEDIDFARLLAIFASREEEHRGAEANEKTEPRSMLQQQPEQYRQGLKVLPKFLEAQKNKCDRWTAKGCGWMGGEDLWRWCGVMSCHRCRFHAFAYYTGKPWRWLATNAKNKSRSMLQQQPEQYRQGLKLWPKFLEAQKNKRDRWTAKGCGWMGGEDLWRWCGVMSCHRCRVRTFAYYIGKPWRWLATNAKNIEKQVSKHASTATWAIQTRT